MKLYFKKVGEGKPLFILHGLFGLGDNWSTLSKAFAEQGFGVYLIDQRNHGRSEHSFDFNYDFMANDLKVLMEDEGLHTVNIIGHSMGGKTAMYFTWQYPEQVNKMIVADISPAYYPQHHQSVLSALHSMNLSELTSRKQAEEILRNALNDEGTIQFLLKNLYWKTDTQLEWRFGLQEIEDNIEMIGEALPGDDVIDVPTLFLKGERSGYIQGEHEELIRKRFSNVEIKVVPNAGHWVHAENPKAFLELSLEFLLK
jgi:pimeloyl-ACP methyl ester carboxylesterase